MIEVRWLGRGGQGAFTAARLLGLSAALFENKYAQAFPSFGPERRGAPVSAFTRIADQKITDRSEVTRCDYLVVLDETLWKPQLWQDLKPGGTVLVNATDPTQWFEKASADAPDEYRRANRKASAINALAIARNWIGKPIVNTAMLGALVGLSGIISLEAAIQGIRHEMKPAQVAGNVNALTMACKKVRP
ncbi:pyruvate ferredoxin oxidoreductase [Heliobacterium gestii]|uniref:Pyruvate ferredoxin oxidoreductase n=1 Tax=Heliomicrobium gestii TaxID=2699 RepID=A0A845LBC2_HELGE|nr:2-oxoacid:acceptor oxidoreductase family protein [Heliomicrobium gestii]MBM7867694.1 pyruvate ferredoxin oxidoreductase gamma subunit [Heliomicrobium gestii]MZP44087.1 pyruvate ferredoxin oxidoreductase [Heliomicrobium gestii]